MYRADSYVQRTKLCSTQLQYAQIPPLCTEQHTATQLSTEQHLRVVTRVCRAHSYAQSTQLCTEQHIQHTMQWRAKRKYCVLLLKTYLTKTYGILAYIHGPSHASLASPAVRPRNITVFFTSNLLAKFRNFYIKITFKIPEFLHIKYLQNSGIFA